MRAASLLLLFVAGCGTRTSLLVHPAPDAASESDAFAPSFDAGTDAIPWDAYTPDAWVLDAGDPCGADRGRLEGMTCEESIFGRESTRTCRGGFADMLAVGPGVLRWECNGTRVHAEFPTGTYYGTRMGNRFVVCAFTNFEYDDGCEWQSTQRITGTFSGPPFDLTYSEAVSLSDGSCLVPCTATGSVGHQ